MLTLSPATVIYAAQMVLMALTSGFLFWRSRVPAVPNRPVLRFSAGLFATTAALLLTVLLSSDFPAPWSYYARFWSMSLTALQGIWLFAMLYHLPEWNPAQRREVQIVMVLMTLRLAYELYWSAYRTWVLVADGVFIPARPLLADALLAAAVLWLILLIVRRIRLLQQQSGQFLTEAVLLGLFILPTVIAQIAFTSGLISYEILELIRDLISLVIVPLMVLVFLDLLPESVTLLVRLLGVTLVTVVITVSAAAWLIAPLLLDQALLTTAMLRLLALTLVLLSLTLLGVPLLLQRSVFRPLERLLAGVKQVDTGNLQVTVPVTFADEIGSLTASFNRMVAEVRGTVELLEDRVAVRTAALSQSEQRYRELVEQIDEVIFRMTLPEGRIDYVSPSVMRMLGYTPDALMHNAIFMGDVLHPGDLSKVLARSAQLHQGIIPPPFEYRVIDVFGNEHWIEQSNTGIVVADRLIAVEGVCRDVTSQKQAEAQLLAQQSELATLQERERIGRDLHDGLGQVMGYVNVQAQTVSTLVHAGNVLQAQEVLRQLVHVAQEAHTDIRRYILDLRVPPAEHDAVPWAQALQQTVDHFSQTYAIAVALRLPPNMLEAPFTPAVRQQVLQIILEALNNIHKHAAVSTAHVILEQAADHLSVTIADSGRGFVTSATHLFAPQQGSFGLRIMGERAALINASLQIESAPGAGTQVLVRVPVQVAALRDLEGVLPEPMMHTLRVLLVDDHPLFREGMRNMLAVRGVHVVGVAQHGLEAQALARELRPDIILMDMHMPECDGITATQQIKAELPDTKIIMLTVAAEQDQLFRALKAGASGYLLKNLDSNAFFQLLLDATRGEVVLSRELASQTLHEFSQSSAVPFGGDQHTPAQGISDHEARLFVLSARQRSILEQVAAGATYKQIAANLFISEATVKYHMGQIVELLQVANRREAIALARRVTPSLLA
jgi:PAS domain S-box-containing protein